MITLNFKKSSKSTTKQLIYVCKSKYGNIMVSLALNNGEPEEQMTIVFENEYEDIVKFYGWDDRLDGWADNDGGPLMDEFWTEALPEVVGDRLSLLINLMDRDRSSAGLSSAELKDVEVTGFSKPDVE